MLISWSRTIGPGLLIACLGGFAPPAMARTTQTGNMPLSEKPPMEGRGNLAAGREVRFAPAPNYAPTRKGGTDSTDLTDGKYSRREDREAWREKGAVGWRYAGRVNLAVDLGRRRRIEEVAIRFLEGTDYFLAPPWIEVLVSDDGEHYRQVAEASRFGDFAKPNYQKYRQRLRITPGRETVRMDCVRFTNLAEKGRWVALRFYGPVLAVSDEFYVFARAASTRGEAPPGPGPGGARGTVGGGDAKSEGSGFTVAHPQPYFHKPYLMLATNLPLPIPMGLTAPAEEEMEGPLDLTLNLPEGVRLLGGRLGGVPVRQADVQPRPGGGRQYRFTFDSPSPTRAFGRIYFQAEDWRDGRTGELTYRFRHGDWRSRPVTVPLKAVRVEPAPRLKRIKAGLGWWGTGSSMHWPHLLDTWRALGLNTFSTFGQLDMDESPDWEGWRLLERARERGFLIDNIDSPFHRLKSIHGEHDEIYCQLEDGTTADLLCPSYRGEYYQKEIDRFARVLARVKPDYAAQDIEVWNTSDLRKVHQHCTRCRKDFKASGLESWEKWYQVKGRRMWVDLMKAARESLRQEGADPHFQSGGYDFRPGDRPYAGLFRFDALYPEWMDVSQPSTYSPLYPFHLELIGDEARRDRSRLPESDVMPWLTPGDAGTFPAEAFQWALLECFANGSRGLYFWSNRVWDAESFIAYNRVLRAIAPVEDVIVRGDLVGEAARVIGPGRVSGMKRDGRMLLLTADYSRETEGAVRLRINVPGRSVVRDRLDDGRIVASLDSGKQQVTIPLRGKRARLLLVTPASTDPR